MDSKRQTVITLLIVMLIGGCSTFSGSNHLHYPPENGRWQTVTPAQLGWDAEALNVALQQAREHLSTGVILLKDGKIVVERYWALPDPADTSFRIPQGARNMLYGQTDEGYPLEDVASVQKSVVAILAAIGSQKGMLDYDDPVSVYLGDDWARVSPEQGRKITIRHLMSMTSGLNNKLEFKSPPGTVWQYNTNAYQNVLRVLSAASGLDANTLTRQWLTDPLGMTNTRWVERGFANQNPPMMGLVTTPRDLARFGLLIASDGHWQGKEIVTAERLKELLAPSQQLNPAYGLLWWLNTDAGYQSPRSSALAPGKRVPAAPADLVTAAGALNRYVFVLPKDNIVIVRTGLINPQTPGSFDRQWWQTLVRVFEQKDRLEYRKN